MRPIHLPRPLASLLVLAALSGCGVAAAAPAAPAAAWHPAHDLTVQVLGGNPAMVVLSTRTGAAAVPTVPLTEGRQVMLMLVNRDSVAHHYVATIPVAELQLQTAQTGVSTPPSATANGIGVTLAPGAETDVLLTPTARGDFPLREGAALVASLQVG